MLPRKLSSLSVGQKLIAIFSIGLLLIITSIVISTILINKIDEEYNILRTSAIPALLNVNAMSSTAHELIQSSISIGESNSIDELINKNNYSLELMKKINVSLSDLNNNTSLNKEVESLNIILSDFERNLSLKVETVKNSLHNQSTNTNNIIVMKDALKSILHFTKLVKINTKSTFHDQLQALNNENDYATLVINSTSSIDAISELIAHISELKNDLNAISNASTKDEILAIQQEFDHSLRAITRTVVNHKELNLKNDLSPHILTLIKYGQDSPDIFDVQLVLTNAFNQTSALHNDIVSLTTQLNDSVNILSNNVKNSTENSSISLNKTIINSKYAFNIIAIASIIIFLIIIIKFIYKDIVVRMNRLSIAANKLSSDDLNFEIDTSGEDELSKFASTLNMLKSLIKVRKKFHDDLKTQAKLLQRSNEDLSLFAYVASHDLQEPLRVISSYSQLLSKRYSNTLDADADKFIDYVVSGCSRMEALIEGLLRLSRIDTEKANNQSVWIEEVLQEIKGDLKIRIKETFTLITWDEMPTIYADPVQIRTIFQNIISNAIKYNHSTPPKVHISTNKEDKFWKFYIKDNGIGIDAKNYEKIFVIFKRLHSRNKYSGTGIGLSICKKIIERYGGEISLDSDSMQGTTFIFTLPIDDRFCLDDNSQIAA